jgi:hypothetical protein
MFSNSEFGSFGGAGIGGRFANALLEGAAVMTPSRNRS